MSSNVRNAEKATHSSRRGRPPSGPAFTDEEVRAVIQMRIERRWSPQEFYNRVDRIYALSRAHFDHCLIREGKRRGISAEIRAAFAAAFDWPKDRFDDFPLGCMREFLSMLPAPSAHFVGRHHEVNELNELWHSKDAQVVELVGQGGIGKTALVNAWINQLKSERAAGVRQVYAWSFFSQGDDGSSSPTSAPFLAQALEWFGVAGQDAKKPWEKGLALAQALRREKTLLVLDGVERLQHAPGVQQGGVRDEGLKSLLRELVRSGHPGLCVLTTRWAIGELAGYKGSIRPRLTNLQAVDGAMLLWQLGANKWAHHTLKPSAAELLKASQEYKGHALALNLLGRFIAVLHAGDIRKRALIPPLQDLPEDAGGQAVRIMRSYEKLLRGKPELEVLRLLGLFDRPADVGALDAIVARPSVKRVTAQLGRVSDLRWKFAIERLRALHLVDPPHPDQPEAVDCHTLIREHFGGEFKRVDESAWRQCHRRLYSHFKKWNSDKKPESWQQIEPLYRAIGHGCKGRLHQRAFDDVYVPLVAQDDQYYSTKVLGAFTADLEAMSGFFARRADGMVNWQEVEPSLKARTKALVLGIVGWELRAVGRLQDAKVVTQAALDHFKGQKITTDTLIDIAINAGNLSELTLLLGEFDDSVVRGREAVTFADQSKELRQRSIKRARLADSLHQAGKFDEAQAMFKKAESLYRELKPDQTYMSSWQGFWLCEWLLTAKRFSEVLMRASAALTVANKMAQPSPSDLGLGHLALALAQMETHGTSEAQVKHNLTQASERLRDSQIREFEVRASLGWAQFRRQKKDFPAALKYVEEAKEIAERNEMKLFLIPCELEAVRIALAHGKRRLAHDNLRTLLGLRAGADYGRWTEEVALLRKRLEC